MSKLFFFAATFTAAFFVWIVVFDAINEQAIINQECGGYCTPGEK
jgi:hypothetical protein